MTNSTYCVYRIVCFPNCKIYVGKAKNVGYRKSAHFYTLKNQTHVNAYLQAAYNKYGKDAFYFEIIETGIVAAEISNREQYWIAYFDSYKNGFNMTIGGEGRSGRGKECVWNGVLYPTITAAAEICGIDTSSMIERVNKGYTCDDNMPGSEHAKNVPCIWNGIKYSSITAAAIANNLDPMGMANRIKQGYTCDADIFRGKKCEWNGVLYPTVRAAAKAVGVKEETMHYRVNKGYKADSDITKKYSSLMSIEGEYE